jgi:hypothetical protein
VAWQFLKDLCGRSEHVSFVSIPGKDPVLVFVDAAGSIVDAVAVAAMTADEIVAQLETRGFVRKPPVTLDPGPDVRDEL